MDLQSPKDSDRIKLSLQLNNGKIPQNMPKIKNMTLNENKSNQVIKLNNLNMKALTRVDSSEIIETDRFAFGNQNSSGGKKTGGTKQLEKVNEREKKPQSKFSGWSQSEVNFGEDKINLNLNNYNNYNKAIQKSGKTGISAQVSQEKLIPMNLNASQRVDSIIPPPTPFGVKA